MRPIRMTMSAFLSYSETQEIDFEKLGTHGLYLIMGETGAGKTAIFDGIMFALYGEASGDLRDGKMCRSKYAKPDSETYVELLFECGGKKYRVKRSPEYERTKKRGTGTTKAAAEAELEFFDGRPVVTKTERVTEEIEGIIGLTREQFSQTAMIAQGQFRELLTAETKDRRAIFRHIFKTENFDSLQTRIYEDFKALHTEVSDCKKTIDREISGIRYAPEDGVSFPTDLPDDADLLEKEIRTPLSELLKADEEKQKVLQAELTALEESQRTAIANKEKARKYEEAVEAKERKDGELKKNGEALTKAKSALDKAEAKKPRIEEIRKETIVEREKLGEYEKLDEFNRELNEANKEYESKKDLLETAKKETAKLDGELQTAESELKTLSDAEGLYANAQHALKEAGETADKCRDIAGRFEELKKKQSAVQKTSVDTAKKKKKADELCEKANAYRNSYIREQAGFLAKDLKDGEKCPVCGSVHHPEPAVLSDNAVTKKEVDKANEEAERVSREAVDAATKLGSENAAMEAYKEETEKQARKLTDDDDLVSAIGSLQQKFDLEKEEAEQHLQEAEGKVRRKTELDKSIPDIRKKKEDKETEIGTLQNDLSGLKEKIEGLTDRIQDVRKKLKFKDKAEAERHIGSLEKEAKTLQSVIDDAEKEYEDLGSKNDTLTGEIKQLAEEIASSEKTDLKSATAIVEELSGKIDEKRENDKKLDLKMQANKKAWDNIEEKKSELSRLLARYVWLKTLNDTVNGKSIDENGKLMLETYVQQAYFDRIVAKANIRFERMSRGHYTLSRIKEVSGGKQQSGLDLEVIDHYNGSRRGVGSLSGGEQFEASLSLALGLSDMVQETSAGVKLDCMFIDEGFGSLDKEALNPALIALRDLSDGNCLVGVISHVDEMQNAIDKKIRVTKNAAGGSSAKIEI